MPAACSLKPVAQTALCLLALVATACPGSLPSLDGVHRYDQGTSTKDGPRADGPAIVWKEAGPGVEGPRLDKPPPAPDLPPPPPDKGPTTGGPCPCTPPLICVSNVCRATCTAPTGLCKVTSNCPATEACVGTTSGSHFCMPAVAPGQPCDPKTYCPNNHVCASFNAGPYTCKPICNALGAPCGGGGQCAVASGCMFCSVP
jgi:hypothetical protein